MNSTESARGGSAASRMRGHFTANGIVIVGAVLLAILLSGCGSSAPAPAGTQAPEPVATPASIDAVWQQMGATEAPLFGLAVTEPPGFTDAERKYLRGARIAWSTITNEAAGYGVAAADPKAASRLAGRIERRAAAAAALPSPSSRFSMLHDSVRSLMRRVVRMATITKDFSSATSDDEKGTLATRLARIATPLAAETLRVADWGVEMRNRYGGVYYAAVSTSPSAATTTPSSSSTPAPQPEPNPDPNPNPNPNPQPKPKPKPHITAAEARQIAELADLDAWLTSVVDETKATVEGKDLPWTEAEVDSFSLNMGYIQEQCELWLGRKAAGSRMAAAYKQYLAGLSQARKGAAQLDSAAQHNDAGHQKALNAGNTTLTRAASALRSAMARLEALR